MMLKTHRTIKGGSPQNLCFSAPNPRSLLKNEAKPAAAGRSGKAGKIGTRKIASSLVPVQRNLSDL